MRNAQALRACPVRDGARPAFPGHLTSALGWPQGLPRTTHRREGLGWPRSAGRGSYAAGRWRPAPLPLPCRGGAGGPAPGHGGVRMGTSALPGEQAWAAWPAPAGHPHLLKCCPLVGGGEPPDTRSTSKAVRGGAAKLRSRYSSARTHHGWEDGSDGPEAQAASVPAGPGDT